MIDKRKVINALHCCYTPARCDKCPYVGLSNCSDLMIWEAMELLQEQPDIVHCGECKHAKHWYRDKALCFLWDDSGVNVFEDGYCNYGERGWKVNHERNYH